MVKVGNLTFPPGYEALVAKILAWYDNQIYPTWATRNRHNTRSAKKRNLEKTLLPSISGIWKGLTPAERAAWSAASDFSTLNGYQLFTSDYSYRRKNGLSLPGTPNNYHDMFSLEIDNPGGVSEVRFRRDEKDLVGPVNISFNYKKVERQTITLEEWSDLVATWADATAMWTGVEVAAWSDPNIDWADVLARWAYSTKGMFHLVAILYYFEDGQNKIETHNWDSPAGPQNWNTVSFSMGTSGKKYFHLTLNWYMDNYDATVDFDHLLITSAGADKYRECWQFKSGKTWEYDNLYRKMGWLFSPAFAVPYFQVLYLT
jgi:hypothetical protein